MNIVYGKAKRMAFLHLPRLLPLIVLLTFTMTISCQPVAFASAVAQAADRPEGFLTAVPTCCTDTAGRNMERNSTLELAKAYHQARYNLCPMDWACTAITQEVGEQVDEGWGVTAFDFDPVAHNMIAYYVSDRTGEVAKLGETTYSEQLALWEASKGKYYYWSLEDKAFFGHLFIQNPPRIPTDENRLPSDVIALAKNYLLKEQKIAQNVVENYKVDINFEYSDFLSTAWDAKALWIVAFRFADDSMYCQLIISDDDGSILSFDLKET